MIHLGFGDTEGIHRDKEVVEQISKFLETKVQGGITHIDAIGFVIQSSLARLTPTQKYVFNSISSLFGKDIADNIFLFLTFSDGQKPQVLSGIREADLPYNSLLKFNNSALFVSSKGNADGGDGDEGDRRVDRIFWNIGTKSYKKLMKALGTIQPKSLVLTQEVLREREKLEVMMQDIQQNIKVSLAKLEELETEKKILKENEAYIDRNKDFSYETLQPVLHRMRLPNSNYAMNCTICKKTCHSRCRYRNEEIKKCLAMEGDHCKFCPYKCHWNKHKSEPFIYELRREQVTKTSEELKKRYNDAIGKKSTTEQFIEKCQFDLDCLKEESVYLADKARMCLKRLNQIALKPNPLSTTDYMDLMIQEEEFLARPGWNESVKHLQQIKEQAEMMQRLQEKEGDISETKRLGSASGGQDGLTVTDRVFLNLRRFSDEAM